MGRILEHWRIFAAGLFSVALIIGAFVLARGVESPPAAQASTETALLQAIATKDSDNDDLPDWEEALYGTNPNNSDSFNLGMRDGEAVDKGLIVPKAIADTPVATSSPSSLGLDGLPPPPAEGTLTAAFAQKFLSLYLTAKQNAGTAGLSENDFQNIANEAVNSLSKSIVPVPDFKSSSDLFVSESGADALKTFAASAEAVLLKNTADAGTNEINYLSALLNNDASALPHLVSIAKVYRDSAAGLAVLPVPKELAADDLALVNTMMRMSGITNDFARAGTDPLAAMLALQQYSPTVRALGNVFTNIGNIYSASGITLPAGTPGASFVNVIKNVAAKQAAAAASASSVQKP